MNKPSFPWYVINKQTRFVVAGFAEFDDAYRFLGLFKHDAYVVLAACEI